MQLLPLALFGGVVVVSWLWSPAAPYLVSVFLGMLVIWLIFMTVLLRSAGRKTRDIAALFDAVPRDLVSFLAIDGRSFLVSAAEVRSVDIAPRSQWKNTGRVAGTLRFVFLSASTTWTPMRVVVVGPYDIVAIRKELVTAGFPVRN